MDARVGKGLRFDGSADEVDFGPIFAAPWAELTISALVFHEEGAEARVLSKAEGDGGGDHVFALGVQGDDAVARVATDGEGETSASLRPGGSCPQNEWHALTMTWSAVAAELEIYVDGESVATQPVGGETLLDQTSDLVMGNSRIGGGREFLGILDEVRLERVARGAAWIALQNRIIGDEIATYGAIETLP